MTPEERRELAKRLAVEHQHTTPSGKVGLCTCRACDDLRRAAAALCEDADMGQRASDELLRACEAERERDELRERLADAVVIPRSAIPDDLPGDLLEMAEEVSEYRRVLGDHDRLVTAARLLSGATTEKQRCPECGGYGWIAEPDSSTGEPINPQQCPTCRGDGLLSGGATEARTCWPEEGT